MTTPTAPTFIEIHPPELRPALQSAWREGYGAGWFDRSGLGGKSTSEAKIVAAKKNGKKGGRPSKDAKK